jgi:NAD(P)-dependent dehydrogenase (short-subunit alcohol dehydrogenase family)
MFDVQGKRVLVTGASAGLGAAMAVGLAERGATVGLCARRADRLAGILADVRQHQPASRSWTVDLADLDGIDAFAADVVDQLGGLDILINNAGIPKRRWAWEHRPDEIADVLRINVESPMRLTLALLDALGAARGHVVFIGSVAARLSPPNEAVYAASKAAITAFAESLSVDLRVAGSPIGVHVIQPGVLDTELFEHPDNDRSLADIEALPATAIVDPVLAALESGAIETFVPDWFADIPALKTSDVDGFLTGAVQYTGDRLDAEGRPRPTRPETAGS